MPRFALAQPDRFAPAATGSEPASCGRPPLDQLAGLRAAERLPWPDLCVAMAEEQRYLALAGVAGAAGKKFAAAIMDETERRFAAAEQEAANASAPAGSSHDQPASLYVRQGVRQSLPRAVAGPAECAALCRPTPCTGPALAPITLAPIK